MLNKYRYNIGQFKATFHTYRFSGKDVPAFLQAQTTVDVARQTNNTFHLACLLDPHGRVEVYGWLANVENSFIYLVPEKLKEAATERLNRYLISEDVIIDDSTWQDWWVVLGPKSKNAGGVIGVFFDEEAHLHSVQQEGIPAISSSELELWRALTGWPSFDGADLEKEILNNLRLYELALTPNKGCYPGQETVAKIATRRGAAFAPVLLEVQKGLPAGDLFLFDRKIGKAGKTYEWEGKRYQQASLLRDFRVDGMKIEGIGTVHYYPLISGDNKEKARELFYQGSDFFKNDDIKQAEASLRLAIELDPSCADAYEALGVLLGRLERFPEAAELMEKLIEVDPSSVMAHSNLSLYLMRMGRIEEAEDHKAKATVKSFQKFGEEARLKEELELQKNQKKEEWQKRESMFQQVLEIDEDDALANYGLGSIAVEREEWERARKHLEKVLSIDPKYSVAYLALGRAYLGLGLHAEARKTWKEGISVAAAKGDLMPANQMQSELDLLSK